jgi:hypothetical protein
MYADAAADNQVVSDLVVKPWVRYGHDRLYVQTADGTRLGYWDNKTNTAVLADVADQAAFHVALRAHRSQDTTVSVPTVVPVAVPAQAPAVEPVPPVPAQPEPPVEPVEEAAPPESRPEPKPDWTDLAVTRAGAAAREQALALKQAAPVKTFFARALGVKTDERAWRIGADAEQEVAARLRKLGDRWKVLHAVPVGENGSDIDHVVVGRGGVFTINTKHHPDASIWVGGNTFMVDGHRVPYVRNSRFEARRTATFLTTALGGVPVITTGVIAVMGARKGFTVKSQPPDGDVVVITRREVAKWLSKRAAVLSDEQVQAIYAVARRSDTWR